MWQPEGLENAAFRLVPTEELFAGKMLAMLDRVAPRDLFDVMLLPELDNATWGSPRLRKIFIALSATLAHPLMQYGKDRLTRIDDRVVDEQLSPMILIMRSPQPSFAQKPGRPCSHCWSSRTRSGNISSGFIGGTAGGPVVSRGSGDDGKSWKSSGTALEASQHPATQARLRQMRRSGKTVTKY
jgi:hypothetical protein